MKRSASPRRHRAAKSIPRPRHGYVWAPGHWEWRAQRYDWNPGVWIAERPGYVYAAPAWTQRDGRWQHGTSALVATRPERRP